MILNGVINVLKPPGMTSSNVVVHLKHLLNTKKVGHCGTLDPGASGVLTVCVGRATKIADYLMDSEKEYISEFVFGCETDTFDSYGKVTDCDEEFNLDINSFNAVINSFIGKIKQIPPKYSAIKIEGIPLYKHAIKNTEINIPERTVIVSDIQVLNYCKNRILLKIRCSKGTYIRSLCNDISHALNTVGYVSFLLRTFTCGASVESSYTIEEIQDAVNRKDYGFVNTIKESLQHFRKVNLDSYLFDILISGTAIDLSKIRNSKEIEYFGPNVVFCNNNLIGIGFVNNNFLKIKTMLYQQGVEL